VIARFSMQVRPSGWLRWKKKTEEPGFFSGLAVWSS
jgi:hypothetical protein